MKQDDRFQGLAGRALELGFSGAALIDAGEVVVEDGLALLCEQPRCKSYGLAPSCPPHVSGTKGFRRLLGECSKALVVKMDLPTQTLLSDKRIGPYRFLHENVAALEGMALDMGCEKAAAFAGGSCKWIFCRNHPDCAVLAGNGACRHPQARPSMSGFGVNVTSLMASAGWELPRVMTDTDPEEVPMGNLVGLVLLG